MVYSPIKTTAKPMGDIKGETGGAIHELMQRIDFLEGALAGVAINSQGSHKRPFKTRTQTRHMPYMTRALCVDTIDPFKLNRVRFFHPLIHKPHAKKLQLPFASPVSAMGGFDDSGLNWVPPASSTVVIFFENGNRNSAFYFGTTWQWSRGPGGANLGFDDLPEWDKVYSGHRKGYLVGPNDESQCLPPWNTESYNGKDWEELESFIDDVEEQKRITYPNIYGFKTPEKHMFKMVDGNAKCNRRWKRLEVQSGGGNYMIFKDDHIHYGGQWGHPSCPPDPGGSKVDICSIHDSEIPYLTDIHGKPIEGDSTCDGKKSPSNIIDGHPTTPDDPPGSPHGQPGAVDTKYKKTNKGSNPYFKHENECRPLRGPQTPQNNKLDLPQSGIQFLSISGHTMVMDDSVEEPSGIPNWERSTKPFDFGCNDVYNGLFYVKSATGHSFVMSDVEETDNPKVRGISNYVELLTATGNKVQLHDHSIKTSDEKCKAGARRGIHLESTSKHEINMVDENNDQCNMSRREGTTPNNLATDAYVNVKTGYGLEMRWSDDHSQRETQNQWIQITNPQCAGDQDEKCNKERGPHFMRFQGKPKGEPGIIFLRAGGHSIRSTYDMDIVLVGDKEKNPSDKFTYVSKMFMTATEETHFRYAGDLHVFFAENQILLMAGRDCPPKPPKECKGPCLYPVIIGRCPVACPLTGITHWTEKAMSERVFASGYHPCDVCDSCEVPGKNCTKEEAQEEADSETETVETGADDVQIAADRSGGA